jgi:hypothetical protein
VLSAKREALAYDSSRCAVRWFFALTLAPSTSYCDIACDPFKVYAAASPLVDYSIGVGEMPDAKRVLHKTSHARAAWGRSVLITQSKTLISFAVKAT